MPPTPDIALADLGVRAPDRWILRGFSLAVAPGEKVALAGPSGTGKSTVLRAVLGLAVAAEGSVAIRGTPVDGRSCWELRRHLAWVAQEPVLGEGTVREALERPFTYRANQELSGNLERVPGLMERFSLKATLLDDGVATLSGGEKQRVALVAALLLDRPILLLDEASSALDPENARAVADYLKGAEDLTVLSVSHDTGWAAFSDRTVALAPVATETGATP